MHNHDYIDDDNIMDATTITKKVAKAVIWTVINSIMGTETMIIL